MAEDLMQKLDTVIEQIKEYGDTKRDPPAAKKLENIHIVALMNFIGIQNSDEVLSKALSTLGDAARIQGNRDFIGAANPMPILLQILKQAQAENHLKKIQMSLRLIGNMCFDHPYNRTQLQKAQGSSIVVLCLQNADEEVQRVACGCIANLASATEEISVEIYKLGGVDYLLKLLRSPNDNVQCMAARALRNVCETEEIQSYLSSQGTLTICLDVMKNTEDDDGMVLEFMGVVNAMIASKPIYDEFIHKHEGISILIDVLEKSDDVNLITDIQDFLNTLTENEQTRTLFFKYAPRLKKIFVNKDLKLEVRVCAGKTYTNISASDDILPQYYSELDQYLVWIEDENKDIQVVAAMLIGSLARVEKYCLEMVQRKVATTLIRIIRDEDRDLRVRHYCTGALRNISIDVQNKRVLLSDGAMAPLIKLLQQPKMNQVVVYQAIGVIKNLILGGAEYIKVFLDEDGLANVIKLTTFDESDHLKFESCRVVALLAKESLIHSKLISEGGLPALTTLINGKFGVLKLEAITAINALAHNGYCTEVALTPGLVSGLLSSLNPTITPDIEDNTKKLIVEVLHHFSKTPTLAQHIFQEGGTLVLKNATVPNPEVVVEILSTLSSSVCSLEK